MRTGFRRRNSVGKRLLGNVVGGGPGSSLQLGSMVAGLVVVVVLIVMAVGIATGSREDDDAQ